MKKFIVLSILLIIAALVFWFFYPLRSYVVMSVYSAQHEKESVMTQNNFTIDMQAGSGWYPFVMTYNVTGFSAFVRQNARMSIMYNFGAFDAKTRTSSLYDKNSDKYSSFYGAYVVQSDDIFGFSGGEVDMEEIALAVEYDYARLVIKDFGCEELTFAISGYSETKEIEYAGSGGWTLIDAVMTTNGAAHNFIEHKTPYLQYGKPMDEVNEDFEVIELYGRIYTKYFKEYDCTIMIYVIAPSMEAAEDCDNNVLKQTIIRGL